ncbi:alanine racemase [Brachybacterium phenoliresistens]|uniref:Alanine racemase n=1 Tax=Brachybacterium phenoliresistens TaxID=396014 RepID=Z9JWH0_9MICO|nr:alanine racemase [Brachybacterium phenoliresistens]EWS82117.1 alanine racemase [Brachybacterium phenoliresistens]
MTVPIPAEDPRHVPNRAVIDPSAITYNTRQITGVLEEQTALMAIVKADGYGHGMLTAARAALEGGATWLGAAHPASALALSRAGLDVPILTWLFEPSTAQVVLPEVIKAGVDVSVGSELMLRMVADAARAADRRARVHIKIDTGMGRGGVVPSRVRELGHAATSDDYLSIAAAWTHLSAADDPSDPMTDQQVETFDAAFAQLCEEVGPVPLQHISATAATLTRPELHRDLVRIGIGLYGYPPVPSPVRLRPALTLTTRVAMVKEVPAGSTVGYGHIHTTDQPTRLGLLPIGYADGLHRASSGKVEVLVRTRSGYQAARQVGRISMDQIVVDLGPESRAQAGDEVVLFGEVLDGLLPDEEGRALTVPTAADWAEAGGTIPYEVLTSVSASVPRQVKG